MVSLLISFMQGECMFVIGSSCADSARVGGRPGIQRLAVRLYAPVDALLLLQCHKRNSLMPSFLALK
jgi:hypothetical protein